MTRTITGIYKRVCRIAAVSTFLLCFLGLGSISWGQEAPPDLTEVSLHALADMKVTIAAKDLQRISDTTAAVYVVTSEDIQRFGFTSVPEALRMVPGLDVARVSGGTWAISARGFNSRYSDKLLVLVDGRTMYSPAFYGVFWDVQTVPMEDIERIEVIRGPGGALWGANAVNGVINIITKSAKSTKGGLVVAGTGSEERAFSSVRWGGDLGPSGAYRFSGKFYGRSPLEDAVTSASSVDSTNLASATFRADWGAGNDSFTASGDVYRGISNSTEQQISPATPRSYIADAAHNIGGSVLGRWERDYSPTSGFGLQVFVQRTERKDLRGSEYSLTADLDFQHRFSLGSRNEIVWGTAYRQIGDDIETGIKLSADPAVRHTGLFSAFAQDDFRIIRNVRLTVGGKVERYSSGDPNLQPNIRLLWTPSVKHSLWLSTSRAANRVSRLQTDLHTLLGAVPAANGLNAVLTLYGNPQVKAPGVEASEAGYRYRFRSKFYSDFSVFYNAYHRLYTYEPGTPVLRTAGPVRYIDQSLTFSNGMKAETYGVESAASFVVNSHWTAAGSYSFLRMQLHLSPQSHDTLSEAVEGKSPRNQFQIRNSFNFPRNLRLDSALYFTGRLPALGIDAYSRMDLNLGWNFSERASLSVSVQNALNKSHREFIDETGSNSTLVRRGAYIKFQRHF